MICDGEITQAKHMYKVREKEISQSHALYETTWKLQKFTCINS